MVSKGYTDKVLNADDTDPASATEKSDGILRRKFDCDDGVRMSH